MNALARECVFDAAKAFGVEYPELLSRSRSKAVSYARMAACALLRARYSWSTTEIGKALGRDHTTVSSALKRARREPIASVIAEILGRQSGPLQRPSVVKCSPCGLFDAESSCSALG